MTRVLPLVVALSACSARDDWQQFRPADGGFRVEIPGKPVVRIQQTFTLAKPTDVHAFLVARGARGSFQVSYYELSMALDPGTHEAAAQLDCTNPFTGDGKFTVSSRQPRKLGTAIGFEVTGEAPVSDTLPDGGFEEDRCFILGSRMFHIMAVGPNTANQKRDAKRFMDSFQLL